MRTLPACVGRRIISLTNQDGAALHHTRNDLPDFSTWYVPLIHQPGAIPYDIFCSLWADELLQQLVAETNRYYEEKVGKVGGLESFPPRSILRDWEDVILPGMKAYFAVLILMGLTPHNSYELYWTTSPALDFPGIKNILSWDRSFTLQSCLHACNNVLKKLTNCIKFVRWCQFFSLRDKQLIIQTLKSAWMRA